MSDSNTTSNLILQKISEHNQSIHEISSKLIEHTQSAINTPPCLSKDEIICIINDRLLDSIEGVNTGMAIAIAFIFGLLTLYTVLMGLSVLNVKKVRDEILQEVKKGITEEINEKSKRIDKNIKKSILKNHQATQEDEYLRNLIFYDLSKILASDINELAETDMKKVFNLYSTRLLVATQLTSGDKKQIKRALKMLSLSAYKPLRSFISIQNYIKTLELRDDLDIEDELLAIKKSLQEDNSIFNPS